MEKLIESIIAKTYYSYRVSYYDKVKKLVFATNTSYAYLLDSSIVEPLISFSGWEFSYDWYGNTAHREVASLGKEKIYQHVITLNSWFNLMLMGSSNVPNDFTFAELVKTLAHEIAHCLTFDFYPATEHTKKEEKLAIELEEYLWKQKLVIDLQQAYLNSKKK